MQFKSESGANNMEQLIDLIAAQEAALSVEEWFDIYGVAILKREGSKQRKAKAAGAGR
jgi:predicted oxidoreductase